MKKYKWLAALLVVFGLSTVSMYATDDFTAVQTAYDAAFTAIKTALIAALVFGVGLAIWRKLKGAKP